MVQLFGKKMKIAEILFSYSNRSYFDGIVGLNIKCCEISKQHSDPILNSIKTF